MLMIVAARAAGAVHSKARAVARMRRRMSATLSGRAHAIVTGAGRARTTARRRARGCARPPARRLRAAVRARTASTLPPMSGEASRRHDQILGLVEQQGFVRVA